MKRIVIILGSLVAACLAAIIALVVLDDPKAEAAAIQKNFEQIPNVKVTFLSDLTKQASQVISADIEVAGKGDMSFMGLSKSSFGNSAHIRLSGIGPYGFRFCELAKGEESYGYDIDIGPTSPIPAARSLGITSVQSAIAHYDDLLALVAHWPVTTNEWPSGWPAKSGEWTNTSEAEIHFAGLAGGDYYFSLKQ